MKAYLVNQMYDAVGGQNVPFDHSRAVHSTNLQHRFGGKHYDVYKSFNISDKYDSRLCS